MKSALPLSQTPVIYYPVIFGVYLWTMCLSVCVLYVIKPYMCKDIK